MTHAAASAPPLPPHERPPPVYIPPAPPPLVRHREVLAAHPTLLCCPAAWSALWYLSHLLAYHAANFSVGITCFVLMLLGLALSLLLMPLCGFGAVVFLVLVQNAYHLADLDARLHNTVVADSECIVFPLEDERVPLLPLYDHSSHHASQQHSVQQQPRFDEAALSQFTPRSVLLVVYFGSVKALLGLLSGLNLVFLVVCTIGFFTDKSNVEINIKTQQGTETVVGTAWFYRLSAVGFVVSCVGLHVLGRVALTTTRFFCCEHILQD